MLKIMLDEQEFLSPTASARCLSIPAIICLPSPLTAGSAASTMNPANR